MNKKINMTWTELLEKHGLQVEDDGKKVTITRDSKTAISFELKTGSELMDLELDQGFIDFVDGYFDGQGG